MVTESQVSKDIRQCLDSWMGSEVVQWWERLQSIKIRHQGYWIKGCKPGTSDFLALIRGRDGQLIACFIEAKATVGKLRPEQIIFQKKYHNGKDIFVLTIRNSEELSKFLNNYGIDKLEGINL